MENESFTTVVVYRGQKCEKCEGTGDALPSKFVKSEYDSVCAICGGKGVIHAKKLSRDEALEFIKKIQLED